MADSASLNQRADYYTSSVGWYRVGAGAETVITLNGSLLAHSEESFPLLARIRLFEHGKLLKEIYSDPIKHQNTVFVYLSHHLSDQVVNNGYFEMTIFPKNESELRDTYFGETWCSVWHQDGHVQVSYPPLMMKGVELKVAGTNVVYPGIQDSDHYSHALLLLNHYDKMSSSQITLYESSGQNELVAHVQLPAKSVTRLRLRDLFPHVDLARFLDGNPGMLAGSFPYKINCFIQSLCYDQGQEVICGMDHLNLMVMHYAAEDKPDAVLVATNNANRTADRVVCTCKSIPLSTMNEWADEKRSLQEVMCSTGAGTICRGCLPEMEKILGGCSVNYYPNASKSL